MRVFIVIDLDGCVADDRWRLPLIRHDMEPCDEKWNDYHTVSRQDKPLRDAVAFIKAKYEFAVANHPHQEVSLQVFTARPAKFEQQTELFVKETFPDCNFMVHMRPNNNVDTAPVLKYNMLRHVSQFGKVHCAFDDREDVCRMFAAQGIKAYQFEYDSLVQTIEPDYL